jgi:hypothetical protein
MKLENKYLFAYLPYGLKCQHARRKGNIKAIDVLSIETWFITRREYFKPILRPLSDLVIDENLIEDFIGLGNWCNAYDEYIDNWYPDASYAQQAPYEIFEYFLVNHYDVYELIPNNLAIDINTIK